MAKIILETYDPNVTKPPYQFLKKEEFECDLPETENDLGVARANELHKQAFKRGYIMRFYTVCDGEFHVNVTPDAIIDYLEERKKYEF